MGVVQTQLEDVAPARGSAALRRLEPVLMHVLLPGAFVLLVLGAMPLRTAFEFDSDEGLNLIKAALFADGYALYREIWSDQPPLFTAMLATWAKVAGTSVTAARVLVLIFATMLVWGLAQAVRMTAGLVPALVAGGLLAMSWLFVRLSGSVMIGIPSLALAMLAIVMLLHYQRRGQTYALVTSALLMAGSMQVKLFTVMLLPILLAMLLTSLPQERRSRALVTWSATALLSFVAIGWWFGALVPDQLVSAQMAPSVRNAMAPDSFRYAEVTTRDAAYFPLAALGVLEILWRRQGAWLPIAWLAMSALVLWLHVPRWHHHTTLIAIPLCWLAGYGVTWLWAGGLRRAGLWRMAAGLAVVIVAVQLPAKIADVRSEAREPWSNGYLLEQVEKSGKFTAWFFTDRPMYAYRAGLLVPPETAVISRKRIRSGRLTPAEVLENWQRYRPEQIVLTRFRWSEFSPYDDACLAYLDEHYTVAYDDGNDAHYIINAHAKKAPKRDIEQRVKSWLRGWQR